MVEMAGVRSWQMELPQGVADPMFVCELAEHLHMPIGELGERMSNYELNVIWPAYFAAKARVAAKAERDAEQKRGRSR